MLWKLPNILVPTTKQRNLLQQKRYSSPVAQFRVPTLFRLLNTPLPALTFKFLVYIPWPLSPRTVLFILYTAISLVLSQWCCREAGIFVPLNTTPPRNPVVQLSLRLAGKLTSRQEFPGVPSWILLPSLIAVSGKENNERWMVPSILLLRSLYFCRKSQEHAFLQLRANISAPNQRSQLCLH